MRSGVMPSWSSSSRKPAMSSARPAGSGRDERPSTIERIIVPAGARSMATLALRRTGSPWTKSSRYSLQSGTAGPSAARPARAASTSRWNRATASRYGCPASQPSADSGSLAGTGFRLREHRQVPRPQREQEDRRGDEPDRDAPLDHGGRVGLGGDPRHRSLQMHGEQDDVDAVERDTARRERRAGAQHAGTRAQARAREKDERKDAPGHDLDGEEGAEGAPEGAGELMTRRHVAEAEGEVHGHRPERDLSHRRERAERERAAPGSRDPHLDEDDERRAGGDRRQEERHR